MEEDGSIKSLSSLEMVGCDKNEKGKPNPLWGAKLMIWDRVRKALFRKMTEIVSISHIMTQEWVPSVSAPDSWCRIFAVEAIFCPNIGVPEDLKVLEEVGSEERDP